MDVRGRVVAYRRPGKIAFARFGRFNANGVTGYVRARKVRLRSIGSRIVIDLSARRLLLFRRGRLALAATAAIGARATPTPAGRFYVNQRFRSDPEGPYGWAAIGISAFSDVLTGWPQGGPVAIHGTNRPSLLGMRVSNGCIRVSNASVRRLWRLAPTGTPVLIRV